MEHETSLILHGDKPYFATSQDSLGKQFLNNLKSRNPGDIVNIDAATGNVITCCEFIEYTVKLATYFKNAGLKHGDCLSIISENNLEYYVVVLAALYIGVTVCPLNPDYTLDELRHGFKFSKSKVVVCSDATIKNATALQEENECITLILSINNENEGKSHIKSLRYCIELTTMDVDTFEPEKFDISETGAFIFLSSGTTGLPKGVWITHQNMTVTVANIGDPRYDVITPSTRLLTVLPFFHMMGNLMQLVTLAMPITTIILNKFRPELYLQAIQTYQPTKLIVVPPLVMFLARSPLVDRFNTFSVKEIICSGATLANTLLEDTCKRFPGSEIRQMYGITETGGFCLTHIQGSKAQNVGIPIPQAQIKVRNPKTHELLGPNQLGELCIKGPMVMKKYVDNVTETENAIDKEGFFCSGDLGYYDDSRCFFIVNRLKEIIKYKGFQVSPSELEQLILRHPHVKDCAVMGIPDERCGELPLAFIVKQNGQSLKEDDIVNYVAERISTHKRLYGGVRFIDEIPKNPSGKILRRKLAELL